MFSHKAGIDCSRKGRSAFTLIEVLVATTILLVIVILVSMVFQGSNTAFQTGSRKIKSQSIIRNVIGMITHDLSRAVDPYFYPGLEGENKFDSSEIKFLAMTGNPGKDDERSLQFITYSNSGGKITRSVENVKAELDGDSVKWSCSSGGGSPVVLNNEAFEEFKFEIINYTDRGATTGTMAGELPDCIEISASLSTEGDVSFVAVRSAGKDKQFGTKDDIVVGGDPFNE